MNRTYSPTCPHCDYEFDEEQTWHSDYKGTGTVYVGDGDDSKLNCPNDDCKKSFHVVCVHETKFEVLDD